MEKHRTWPPLHYRHTTSWGPPMMIQEAAKSEEDSSQERNEITALRMICLNLWEQTVRDKQLPSFYIKRAAAKQGFSRIEDISVGELEDTICRTGSIERLQELRQTLRAIEEYLYPDIDSYRLNPVRETYPEGVAKLNEDIRRLTQEKGYTFNRIVHFLEINTKSLNSVMASNRESNRRPRHCVWDLRRKLESIESELPVKVAYAVPPPRPLNGSGPCPAPPPPQSIIAPGAPCWHCGCSPLKPEEPGSPHFPYETQVCFNCNRPNHVPHTPLIEEIKCGRCGSSRLTRVNTPYTSRDTLYQCAGCHSINRRGTASWGGKHDAGHD